MPEMEKQFIGYDKVNFKTNLKKEDILKIVESFIHKKGKPYEINEETITYDKESLLTKEPVWHVEVISVETKKRFPDAYETLAISDREKRVVYLQNDHGRVAEIF
ncbi:MAG: hypothetical protein NC517_00565 [Firmicutes bacterium]|nr:hypothetical protein [Bacillota bacterium]